MCLGIANKIVMSFIKTDEPNLASLLRPKERLAPMLCLARRHIADNQCADDNLFMVHK
jgi:hypothetical protein